MTLNRTVAGYRPRSSDDYVVPVQEGSVHNLSVAVTPAGKGVFGWVDQTANELRCAVVADWRDLFTDDVVEAADVRTIWSSGTRTIHTGCISVIGDELLAFVSHRLSNNGKVECYVADDVESPTSWSLRGTVQDHTAPDPASSLTVRQSGPPTVLSGGRWVLPMHSWLTFASSALLDGLGLFTTDDSGSTWVTRISDRRGALFGGTAGPQATTVGYDPQGGSLWFGAMIGSVAQWRAYSSTDGASWASNEQASGNLTPLYYIDNGSVLYAGLASGVAMQVYEVGDPASFASWTDLGVVGIDTTGLTHSDGFQIIPLFVAGSFSVVAFTAKDRIARTTPKFWVGHGHVGFTG